MNANCDSQICIAGTMIERWSPRDHQLAVAPVGGSHPNQKIPEEETSISLLEFVELRFVPEYVLKKRIAGRAHFQAILKHILPPERVASAFGVAAERSQAKLKAIPGWPYLDAVRMCDVKPENIQHLIAASLNHGYSAQTAIHLRNVIRSIFSYAIRGGYYAETNPATLVTVPAMARKQANAMSLAQLKQVMELMRYPEKDIALFALLTEMNVAEICGLSWKHVNLSNDRHYVLGEQLPPRTIAVRMQSYRGEYRAVIGKRNRLIPIPELLYSLLQELKSRDKFTSGEDFVLVSRSGTPINPDNIAMRRLKWIGSALEMPWLSWKIFYRTRINLKAEFGRYLHKEFEQALPLRRR